MRFSIQINYFKTIIVQTLSFFNVVVFHSIIFGNISTGSGNPKKNEIDGILEQVREICDVKL